MVEQRHPSGRTTLGDAPGRDDDRRSRAPGASLDGLAVLDAEGLLIDLDPAAETILGLRHETARGRRLGAMIGAPESWDRCRSDVARDAGGGEARRAARRLAFDATRGDGASIALDVSMAQLRIATRDYLAVTVRDRGLARAARQEVDRRRALLHAADQQAVVGTLLAGVGHELNNPLAILLAQATLLWTKAETEDVRRRAMKIHAAAERAARALERFLSAARQTTSERRPLAVSVVVRRAIDLGADRRRPAGVTVVAELDADLRPVLAAEDVLSEVVASLMDEALQQQSGARTIRIAGHAAEGRILLDLSHDGSPSAARPSESGDLPVLRRIVEAYGGSLERVAGPDGGPLIRLALPAAPPARARPVPEPPFAAARLSILVVDDEPEVAASLSEMLGLLGHETRVADSAAAALACADDPAIDAVVADLRMPLINGLELRERLLLRRPDLAGRFALVTGDPVGRDGPLRSGASEEALPILRKPFSLQDVRSVLAGFLSAGRPAGPRGGAAAQPLSGSNT